EWAAVQFNQAAPRDAEGLPIVQQIFSPADRQTIVDGVLKQCDTLDGRADGMIMNVAQCYFRPVELQCSGDKPVPSDAEGADGCLSGAQVGALERAFAGPKDAAGYPIYVPVPFDTGIAFTGPGLPGYLPTGAPGVFGPASRALAMDIAARLRAVEADAAQRLTDTNVWTDLDTFLGRGGKVLFYHGVSDPWFSANDSWDWWQRAAATNGAAFADASRYYMVPGMMHCGGGNAYDRFDLLGPLVDWVENGKAPERPLASRANGSAAVPLCPHPAYPHYTGGDAAKAESYECRAPEPEVITIGPHVRMPGR
ncbi:MAG TPA: tannase/feruloyl esterase family alpha/beta hydrolase, partial [Croceibacterium sp.]